MSARFWFTFHLMLATLLIGESVAFSFAVLTDGSWLGPTLGFLASLRFMLWDFRDARPFLAANRPAAGGRA